VEDDSAADEGRRRGRHDLLDGGAAPPTAEGPNDFDAPSANMHPRLNAELSQGVAALVGEEVLIAVPIGPRGSAH
jgi:hypothetical protein